MMVRSIPVILFIVISFSCVPLAFANDSGAPTSGGPCAYKQYAGIALITSVNKRENSDSYEVKFEFYPAQEITESFAHVDGREFLLFTKRHSFPQIKYLQENGVEVGKDFGCVLNAIIEGTCTPILFEFPDFKE